VFALAGFEFVSFLYRAIENPDINEDGVVEVADVLLIQRKALGLVSF
jgi:hypothetical protein